MTIAMGPPFCSNRDILFELQFDRPWGSEYTHQACPRKRTVALKKESTHASRRSDALELALNRAA
jgi:hypothetical protein